MHSIDANIISAGLRREDRLMVREKETTFLLRWNLAEATWTRSPNRKRASKSMTDMNFLYATRFEGSIVF
jgi:hypothetical protein